MVYKEKFILFRFAKLANEELLLKGLLHTKGRYPTKFLEKYKNKPYHFKIKVIATKILYSLIFGILPLLPILTYFQIVENLTSGLVSVENIILTGIVFFGLYFGLQFFNFFLMCIFESSTIMSGSIFAWFRTLPISREKFSKLAYLTMFRSFDIPIIVIILGLPITMLIGTQNLIIFFVCLGISLLNIIFSFDIVILLGKRLNRVMDFNSTNSKKTLAVRMINLLSYVFIILSSVYVIQWAFGNIEAIFLFVIRFEQPAFVNIVLSIIPFPFAPSYLVSLAIIPTEITPALWGSAIIGVGLYVLLIWGIHSKTSEKLGEISHNESTKVKKNLVRDEVQVEIKTYSPLKAILHRDLLIISHDLKTFMAIIMPIVLSCIFIFSFNIVYMGDANIVERDIFLYWVSILIFCPIITAMLVYGLSNIQSSGISISASLPINPREQATAKIILLMIFQTLAVFAPLLLYVTNSKFIIFLLVSLISLPFTWIILILTFEFKIYFFNKFKAQYKIEDINPENRIGKWVLIGSIQYIIIFWVISFVLIIGITFSLLIFFLGATFIGLISVVFIFDKVFPIIPEMGGVPKVVPSYFTEGKATIFTQHIWLSTFVLLILFTLSVYLSTFSLYPLRRNEYFPYDRIQVFDVGGLIFLILFNLSYTPLLIIIIPKIFGLPYGRKSIKKYLEDINIGWFAPILKYLLWGSIGTLGLYIVFSSIGSLLGNIGLASIRIYFENLRWLIEFSYIFWLEFFFRGVILTILLNRISKNKAIFLNTLIYLIFTYVSLIISSSPSGIFNIGSILQSLIPVLIFYSFIGIFLAYLFVKTKSIFPGILLQMIAFTIGIGLPSFPIFAILFY